MVVYIIGAGPGDIELVTLKAKRLIQEAEVLIYDKLVNEEVLNWAPPNCELIYMGKREKGSESSQETQQEINDLLRKYGPNKRVVRLKGGDPFIFGRGGEEAQICVREGIPFEIVPGISSAFAAPSYAGIPASHRDFNSSFAVLTGHEAVKEESSIDWARLPETLIILMGVANIKDIAGKLIETGRDRSTPVAAIFKGTTPQQKTQMSTLGAVADQGVEFSPPVIFVVGQIASLHKELAWFERKLDQARGKKVVLTSAESHQPESQELLESYGFEVISMPLIEIVPREFTVPDLEEYDALVFTSAEGAKKVREAVDLTSFKGDVFAIGPRTKKSLKESNIEASTGERYNSEGLAEWITGNLSTGSKILALRSSAATDVLSDNLSKMFEVNEVPVYDIKRLEADPERIAGADAVFATSASCAKSLAELDPSIYKERTLVSIGPETSKHLTVPHVSATTHNVQGMIDAYLDHLWGGTK
ncbi:MAG: uroporphyrinogen-III C-methyltransferase [Thermoplasmata archaeon]|nr:uroporphyrinogen-III C-methyltransferase [Thermoplasmata archaeon]